MLMSLIYHRFINGIEVRFGQYSTHDYVIYVGHKLYASIDNIADANREYNAITTDTLRYLGY